MSFQLSAQAITAQTAITRMSVSRCSTLPRQRGSATAPKCPTSRSIAMPGSPAFGREDHPWLGNSPARGISCVAPGRRSWRKLHLATDADTGRVVVTELTDKDADDGSRTGPLLDRIEGAVA